MNLKELDLPFPEDCIEWRILQSGKANSGFWGMAAAYVSARAVMDRLDLVCGKKNWKAEYYPMFAEGISSGIICNLSIRVADEWITKQDGSEQSDNDPFKGGISGALKRAAVHWGIGRYLYDLEQGFVQIVDKGTKGSKVGQTKEKERFYWMPPKLPEWALPEKQSFVQATQQAMKEVKKQIEVSLVQSTEQYVITIGKHKGKLLKDINKEELRLHQSEILEWLKNNPKMSGGNKKLAEQLMLEIDKVL